jgi:hypothetical protein
VRGWNFTTSAGPLVGVGVWIFISAFTLPDWIDVALASSQPGQNAVAAVFFSDPLPRALELMAVAIVP